MKDNFSAQSRAYAQFRPHYPDALIDYVCQFSPRFASALDLATGNGQIASRLSGKFDSVFATDISQKQLDNAFQSEKITYKMEAAEKTSFADDSFDLITVGQAIHWFDFSIFYRELYRILKPDGVFAAIGYGLFSTNPRTDQVLQHFYHDIVGPYWDAERRYVEDNYQTIPFPLNELETKTFFAEYTWTLEQLTGYLDSWSATQHYKQKVGIDPVDLIRPELSLIWENTDKTVRFPMLLRIGRPYPKF